jgi:hypothetical protein
MDGSLVSREALAASYEFLTETKIGIGESLHCDVCDVHSRRVGDAVFLWIRLPEQERELPLSVSVCHRCSSAALNFKVNSRVRPLQMH